MEQMERMERRRRRGRMEQMERMERRRRRGRMERMERGRVGNPPYGTTGRGGRAQEDDTRKVQGEARFCVSTKPCVGVILCMQNKVLIKLAHFILEPDSHQCVEN